MREWCLYSILPFLFKINVSIKNNNKMKNYFKQTQKLAIIAFASIVLFSCSSDDTQTVVKNQAPNSFNLLEVADGALDVDLQPRLTWESATDPDGDPVSYDFYIGTENPQIGRASCREIV